MDIAELLGKRVLSLTQPWATFVMVGAKDYETRSWHTRYRGSIVIHATRETDEQYVNLPEIKEIMKRYNIETFPNGALLGECKLLDCINTEHIEDKMTEQELLVGDFGPGRYAWQFNDFQERIIYPVPIPMRGNMGLWTIQTKHLGILDKSNPKLF